jgi:hypothetical protein
MITPEHYRIEGAAGERYGIFKIPQPKGVELYCIASSDPSCGWEHVSVRAQEVKRVSATRKRVRQRRVPTWREMCIIKNLFWGAEETVVQYHPKQSDYVNIHPHVLHLWRPMFDILPTPPKELV